MSESFDHALDYANIQCADIREFDRELDMAWEPVAYILGVKLYTERENTGVPVLEWTEARVHREVSNIDRWR
jgi:hypothetical protein